MRYVFHSIPLKIFAFIKRIFHYLGIENPHSFVILLMKIKIERSGALRRIITASSPR